MIGMTINMDPKEVKIFNTDGTLDNIVRFYNDGTIRQRIYFDKSGDITHSDNYPKLAENREPIIII